MSGVLASGTDYSCETHSDVIMNTLGKIIEILKKCAYMSIPRRKRKWKNWNTRME